MDEISINYKFKYDKNKILRIFGDEFVENNKKNCRLIINGEQKELQAYIRREDLYNKDTFKIKLKKFKDY